MSPITYNPVEQRSKIGLDNLYFALVTQDDAAAYVAGTPEYLAPLATAVKEPQSASVIQYMDNAPFDVMTAEGETKITLEVSGLAQAQLAVITGKAFDVANGSMYGNSGIPPYVALGFRSMKSNGGYHYDWFLKGKFDLAIKEEEATLSDKPSPKTLSLVFTAVKTIYKFALPGSIVDGVKFRSGDDDTASFTAGATWFGQVQTPVTTTPSALAMTPAVPTNGASAQATSVVCTLTFNNALATGEEFDCILVNNTSHAVIAGVNTIDATRKIVTVAHTAALPAATNITVMYTVRDVYNQVLVGTSSFTTA